MFNNKQFREYIIRPTLDTVHLYSDGAVEMLVFTCAAESAGGTYVHQVKGPAMGIYCMEPATHTDIWINFIRRRTDIATKLLLNFGTTRIPEPERLIYDLQYATLMARLHYLRVADAFPMPNDVDGLWSYYKKHYNTSKGSATKEAAIKLYSKFIKD